MSELCGVLF